MVFLPPLFLPFKFNFFLKGTEKNNRKAKEFYEKSVAMGNRYALNNLGIIHQNGREKEGIEVNTEIAMKLYEISMKYGDDYAINNLAVIYHNGEGNIKQDKKKAVELYEKAIFYSHPIAFYNLALILESGDKDGQVEIDLNRACFLYYSCFNLRDAIYKEDTKKKFVDLIDKEQNQIVWRTEYHPYWKKNEFLNKQIIILLLICKHRKESTTDLVSTVLIKGIAINLIKYLCHFPLKPEKKIEPPIFKADIIVEKNPKNKLCLIF